MLAREWRGRRLRPPRRPRLGRGPDACPAHRVPCPSGALSIGCPAHRVPCPSGAAVHRVRLPIGCGCPSGAPAHRVRLPIGRPAHRVPCPSGAVVHRAPLRGRPGDVRDDRARPPRRCAGRPASGEALPESGCAGSGRPTSARAAAAAALATGDTRRGRAISGARGAIGWLRRTFLNMALDVTSPAGSNSGAEPSSARRGLPFADAALSP